jgi:hypothetical protein
VAKQFGTDHRYLFSVAWPEEVHSGVLQFGRFGSMIGRKRTIQLLRQSKLPAYREKSMDGTAYRPTRYDMQAFKPVGAETFSSWVLITARASLYCLLPRMFVTSPSE